LPEGEEQDGLHCKEFVKWLEWSKPLFSGHVKQHQAVQRQSNAEVVDEGDPHVTCLEGVFTFIV